MASPAAAVRAQYERGLTDEFMPPLIFSQADEQRIRDGDTVFFFNFRADRARQLSQAFLLKDFDGFEREVWPQVNYVTLTQYDATYPSPFIFRARRAATDPERGGERGRQDAIAHRRDGKIPARNLFF